jgi:hypothetical protein
MSDSSIYENEPQIQPRSPYARPGPVPEIRIEDFLEKRLPSLVPRQATTQTSSIGATRTSCGPKDTTGPCERSTDSRDNTTLPITLGVVIPLAVAFIIMVVLHRRNVKKQRKEDAEDRVKSLDFGLGPRQNKAGKKGAKAPEMTMNDAHNMVRKDRGLSVDMGLNSPYLLPPGLQHSRESLHSLSRAFNTGDDKYGRTNFIPDDGSIRSPSSLRRSPDDASSNFTGSSRPRFDYESSKTLVQTSTKSGPPTRKASLTSTKDPVPEPGIMRKPTAPPKDNLLPPQPIDSRDSFVSTTSDTCAAAFRKSNDYLSAFIRGGGLDMGADEKKKDSATKVTEVQPSPPEKDIQPQPPAVTKQDEPSSQYNGLPSNPRPNQPYLPQLNFTDLDTKSSPPEISVTEHTSSQNSRSAPAQEAQPCSQNSSQHNSEFYGQQGDSQNQTRENSYYSQQQYEYERYNQQQYDHKEYDQQQHDHQQHDQQQYDEQSYDQHQYDHYGHSEHQDQQHDDGEDYYDPAEEYSDYGEDMQNMGYDPRRQTMGMRPLPPDDPSENPEQRANRIRSFYKEYFDAPNGAQQQAYYDGSEYYDDYYDEYYAPRGHSSTGGRHRGHTFSNGSYMPGPRPYSSASGRYGHPRGAGPRKPKKKMPPPKALNVLPTPSKLKDDTFLLDQAVDFAPPKRAILQRAGTPDSLRGGQRPYSPTVRAHIPLASSFDDLSAMPSP